MQVFYRLSFFLFVSFFCISCTGKAIPEKAQAVENFEVNRYLGTWYEIARFDFYFEKDLVYTTAYYSLDKNGNLQVLNRGFNVKDNEWKQAKGIAKFRGAKNVGALKVSFFGPFYSGYNVIALDENYQYALVAGKNLDYLWILSREKSIPEEIKQNYLSLAQKVGYDVSRLIWVQQE
ncbi:lipocalin family protein [Myroides sp. DW712]|uniref:lipocalin family protein n=1 Tax=Myroides sp. DW712 TaxID=3389800 RepID=UPI0039797EB6